MTKFLLALVAFFALAAVGAGVYVVLWNRDPVPNDMEACVRKANIPLVRSTDALTLVRPDAAAGDLKVVRRWDWGRTDAVLLTGPLRDYALLALWNSDTPSLARGDVGRRVYDSPALFPIVALERPDDKELLACAEGIDA
jgi:hypothetical protein